MTSVKAKLSIILKANDVVVAEVENAGLWRRVLAQIEGGSGAAPTEHLEEEKSNGSGDGDSGLAPSQALGAGGTADVITKAAEQIDVKRDQLVGACSPSTTAPFLHLDVHCWEAMRKALPSRGSTALSPIAVASTLLAVWFRAAGLGNPTQAQGHAVLRTIGTEDKNATRGIRRATWLQSRAGGQIQLNAANVSEALTIARCFCTKNWKPWLKTTEK